MSRKLTLTSIELSTASGETVKLTIEEARALHAQLHELFGAKEARRETVPVPYPVPVYPLPRPILIPEEWPIPWRPRWEITCGQGSWVHQDKSGLMVSYRGESST